MRKFAPIWAGLLLLLAISDSPARADDASSLPDDVRQLIVGIATDWNQSSGKLWRYQRESPAGEWTRLTTDAGADILLGRNGLAWGRGALSIPQAMLAAQKSKREGDGRAPAGCFAISKIFGNDAALPSGADFPYRQVTRWDAWPDDPANPHYNRHVVIKPEAGVPPWFEKQRMRLGDPAYRWRVEIRHNADPPSPGAGSAIFFHIRRGPDRKTSGCTTMSEGNLQAVVKWLRAELKPHYVLLPRAEYGALQTTWNLPALPGR